MREEKILIADDEESVREILTEILENSEYKVDCAIDGTDAVEKFKKTEYNLVLTDLMMPRLDGLGVLKEAKSIYDDIIVIIMTGYGTMEAAVKALKLGANDFIIKPFETTILLNTVEKNLLSQKLSRENKKLQEQILNDRDQLRKKVLELSVLRNLGVNFSYTFSFSKLFNIIFESLSQAIEYDSSAILDIEKREITIDVKNKISEKLIEVLKNSMLNDISKFYKRKVRPEHLNIKFISKEKIVKNRLTTKSYFNTILWVKDKPFGVINVSSFKKDAFSELDKEFLKNIANQSSEIFSRMKEILVSQREKLQFIIDNLPDGVIMYDINDESILINPRAKMMIERRKTREVKKEDIEKRLNLDFSSLQNEALKNNAPVIKEIKLKRVDDEVILDANIANLTNPDGLIQGLVIVFRDVTTERKLEQLKREFISNVSHELRTPAAVIKEFISILNDEVGGPLTVDQKEYIETMNNNIERLLRLIENLLNISRVDSGTLKIRKAWFDLKTHLKKLAQSFMIQLKEKNIKLKLDLPENSIKIYADSDSITQILTNLVDNTKKYSEKNTEVTIGAKEKNNEALIWVSDQGKGIPPEKQKDVFKRFFRIESKSEARQEGTGLGLPIIKELVELHKGKIEIDSDIGSGTTFFITIPKFAS